jgi:two-component system LytT family response regulator
VVFCTAYDQFAIKAFKYSALNYLLKPVDPEDLKETIRRMEERKSSPSKEQIELLFQNIRHTAKPTVQRIALTTGDGMIFVPTRKFFIARQRATIPAWCWQEAKKYWFQKC